MDRAFHVALGELTSSPSGSITGGLAVRLGERWFPEESWNDFPVIVLTWWLRQCSILSAGGIGRFLFMDGSFSFDVEPHLGGMAVVELLDNDEESFRSSAALDAVIDAIHAAGASALAECARHGWRTADVDELALLMGKGAA